jgi:hypothetical protein
MNQFPSKTQLEELYITENLNILDIAKIYKTSKSKISKLLKSFNIRLKYLNPSIPVPPKEELEKLYIDMNKTIKEIAKIYDVNRNLISSWIDGYDIIKPTLKPSKEILENYYINEKLTLNQISLLYNVDRRTAGRWLKEYQIPSRSNLRKYYHLKAIPFTTEQKEFIVGTLLGDGHIGRLGKNKKGKRLDMTHGSKQLDYLLYKKQIMKEFVNNLNSRVQPERNNCVIWSWASITHYEFNFYHDLFYDNTKKVVREDLIHHLTSPFSLAIWIMDDGWKNYSNIRISSESFTKEENEILKRILKVNFNLICKVCEYTANNRKYYYLSFNKENSILLSNLIRPYFLDSLKYKLLNDSSSTTTC